MLAMSEKALPTLEQIEKAFEKEAAQMNKTIISEL